MTFQRWHYEVAGALFLAAVAWGAGRFGTPAKVEFRTMVREVKVIDEEKMARLAADMKKQMQDRSVTKIVYKDGKPVEKIIYADRDVVVTKTETKEVEVKVKEYVDRVSTQEKIITGARPRLAIGFSVGTDKLEFRPTRYMLQGDVRLVSNLWLTGSYEFKTKAGFAGLKLEF